MWQLKKNNRQIGSYSLIFEGFTIPFNIKSGSRDTLSFFDRWKIRIFPCFLDNISQISLEILGKKYGILTNIDRLCIL